MSNLFLNPTLIEVSSLIRLSAAIPTVIPKPSLIGGDIRINCQFSLKLSNLSNTFDMHDVNDIGLYDEVCSEWEVARFRNWGD